MSYHILYFFQQKIRFTIQQPYMLPILYCQYNYCWCPDDLRNHGISRHGIDPQNRNIPSLESEVLILLVPHQKIDKRNKIKHTYKFTNQLSSNNKWLLVPVKKVITHLQSQL